MTDEPLRQRLLQRAEVIRSAYAHVGQELPTTYRGNWHGHVRIQLLEQEQLAGDEEDTHWKDHVKEQLPTMVERLQDQGYALQDIAFLVRNKREGQEIAATFMEYKKSGSGAEGLSLRGDLAGVAVSERLPHGGTAGRRAAVFWTIPTTASRRAVLSISIVACATYPRNPWIGTVCSLPPETRKT